MALTTFTLDTNCLVAIDEGRPEAVHVRALADAAAARKEEVVLQTERTRRYCALKRRDGKMTNNILQSLAIAAMIALGPTIATAQMMKGPHVSREVWDQVWACERVYIDCLERGAASLALASNDPVETIVDAAKGLCI